MSSRSVLAVVIVGSFISGFVGGSLSQFYPFPGGSVSTSDNSAVKKVIEERTYIEESQLIESREKIAPSVISILQLKEVRQVANQLPFGDFFFFGPGFEQPQAPSQPNEKPEKRVVGGGTGFIITADGLALTNKHVVNDDEAEYLAVLNDGTEYSLEVVGKDPLNDVAVVQIKEKEGGKKPGLPVAELGDSDKIKIGQQVLAIGNALAEYENTTTAGIISATGRDIHASDSLGQSAETLTGLIQTDAAINPGNSGGPLVNLDGQVVGINTAIDTQANGVSFAIPINDVKPVIESIKQYGKVVRPILGVRYVILTEEKAKEFGLEGVTHGAYLVGNYENGEVAVIPGGPADKAGLAVEDVILELDGKAIDKDNTLQQAIRSKQPGDKVQLKIWRKGQSFEVEVTLGMSDELKK